jgi:[ribosomal protein S5]-alanine N-acetyltransferase
MKPAHSKKEAQVQEHKTMPESNRLIISPLSYGQLEKYRRNDGSLEAELGLRTSPRVLSPELAEAMEQTIMPNVADTSKNYLFNTLWTLILKSTRQMVGDICLLGEPSSIGEIEIGYGTYEAFRNQGYMTEAVGAMIRWAALQPRVLSVFAATEKANAASFAVLEKNQFIKTEETDTLFLWRYMTGNKG